MPDSLSSLDCGVLLMALFKGSDPIALGHGARMENRQMFTYKRDDAILKVGELKGLGGDVYAGISVHDGSSFYRGANFSCLRAFYLKLKTGPRQTYVGKYDGGRSYRGWRLPHPDLCVGRRVNRKTRATITAGELRELRKLSIVSYPPGTNVLAARHFFFL